MYYIFLELINLNERTRGKLLNHYRKLIFLKGRVRDEH